MPSSIDSLRASLWTLICTFEQSIPALLLAPSDPRQADSLKLRYKDADTYKLKKEARTSSTKECWRLLCSQLEEAYHQYLVWIPFAYFMMNMMLIGTKADDKDIEGLKQALNASKMVLHSSPTKEAKYVHGSIYFCF
jgi:hypothetical protein